MSMYKELPLEKKQKGQERQIRMLRPIGSFVLLGVLCSGVAQAGQLTLVMKPVDGRGIPYAPPRDNTVCSAYLKNLNSFSPDISSMECGRPVEPRFKDFR